jgi:hypothetical protein
MAVTETPFCFALHIADVIHRDAVSGKWHILGMFDRISVAEFPAELTLAVYYGVTDGRGTMPLKVQFIEASAEFEEQFEEGIAGALEAEISLADPLEVAQASVEVPVRFDWPGAYHCELWVNEKRLMTRRLFVVGPLTETET